EEDQVSEVHRIAAPAVRAAGRQPLRGNRESGTASAFAQPVAADEAVLQIAPDEKRQRPELDARDSPLKRGLGADPHDRPEHEDALRRARQPAHALAASVFGMKKMNRFAMTMVTARKVNAAESPKRSATMPPSTGPTEEPSAWAPNSTPMLVPPMFFGVVSSSHACSTGR